MGNLIYRKGDIFKGAPKGSLLVHACNAQGVWGGRGGVAGQFKQKYPSSFDRYERFCINNKRATGIAGIDSDEKVGWLITSFGYGRYRDDVETILENTEKSLNSLLLLSCSFKLYDIHSPKINSGLFRVPWKDTAKLIETAINKFSEYSVTWTVWEI